MSNLPNYVCLSDSYTFHTTPIEYNQCNNLQTNLSESNKLFNNFYQPISFINDVGIYEHNNGDKSIDFSNVLEDNDDHINTDIHTNLPLFLDHKNRIKVPSKVEYALRRHTPKGLLRDIHPNIDLSVELCLLFTTQLTSTYFEILDNSSSAGWKSLKSEYLRKFLCIDPSIYKKVRKALEHPLKEGAILQCDNIHEQGRKSFHYRLGENYIKKGIVTYELKTVEAQKLFSKRMLRSYKLATGNLICNNLIEFYSTISLPNIEQIHKEARRLIKLDYVTKKGKKLKFLNNHSKSYYKNPERYSFVEDAIKIFEYLTSNGLIIPVLGSEESGGRVVDSFTLMPSWIRKLIKISGKAHVECDYSCLHPNIAIALYGGKQDYLTHDQLELITGIDNAIIKREHLSFFNKSVWQMRESPLWQYYLEQEPQMLENLIQEKRRSNYKHKVTSRKMFEKEVGIMTDVIDKLNSENIYVGYVYDALFCHPEHANRVKEVMDEIVLRHGIKTRSKLSDSKNHNPKVETAVEKKFEEVLHIEPQATANSTIQNPISFAYKDEVTDKARLRIDAGAINFINWAKQDILEKIKMGENVKFIDAIVYFRDGSELKEKVLWVDEINNSRGKYITKRFVFETKL